MIELREFDKTFLFLSYRWLNDEEMRRLTDTRANVTLSSQLLWYNRIKDDSTYKIWGIVWDGIPIGACGIKHITNDSGEYWGYIGEKAYWGGKGHQLFICIYEKALELGLSSLSLKVLKDNIRAINLYKKEGFVVQKEIDDVYLMIKQI